MARDISVRQLSRVQTLHNPRPPSCIWDGRRRQRLENAKELLRADLGFDENDEPEETDVSDEEPEVDSPHTQ